MEIVFLKKVYDRFVIAAQEAGVVPHFLSLRNARAAYRWCNDHLVGNNRSPKQFTYAKDIYF